MSKSLIPVERIEKSILLIRDHKVILDADLAQLYGVETKVLVRAVKRNMTRFPAHFMFQLTKAEFENLRFQFGTSRQWGGRRYPPYAFTEQGVAMLSGVLQSKRAIQVNIKIMDAFVRMRQLIASQTGLMQKILAMEKNTINNLRLSFRLFTSLWMQKKNPSGESASELNKAPLFGLLPDSAMTTARMS